MPETRFRKGDLVQFQYSIYPAVQGVVKEDRGPLGIGGRRLYLIEFRHGRYAEALSYIELPAEDLQRVERPAAAE
jgi:hypothetical protein